MLAVSPVADRPPQQDFPIDSQDIFLSGAARAKDLLNGVPNRFYDFSHMDQFTFAQLADWCMDNSQPTADDVSIEESLLIFLDVVGHGSSFRMAGDYWSHDPELIKKIFLNMFHTLRTLRQETRLSPSYSKFNVNRSRWRVLKVSPPSKKEEGYLQVGADSGDGLELSREELIEVLTGLNNFIHEHREY